MVARGVGRELAASVAAHRDILYRIQHPCGMIIPCFSPVVNTFFCGFGGSRNFRDIVTKTTGYSGVVWLKGRPGRHGGKGRTTRPAGGLPGWLPADLAAAVPSGGACLLCRLPTLPLVCFIAPIPGGKGEIFSFLMQGASPLASPGLNPGGTEQGHVSRARRVACPAGRRLTLPFRNPQRWLAFFVACQPCL